MTARRHQRPCGNRARRLAAWTAALALLLNAVVPVYAMAAGNKAGDRIPVCTGSGIVVWAVADRAPDGTPDERTKQPAPCPYCLVHASAFTPPAPVHIVEPAVRSDARAGAATDHAGLRRQAYGSPHSRAPPSA